MSLLLGIAAWLSAGTTYAVIGVLVVLAVAAHFFSRSVSLAAWALAVGALALLAVGKDAIIASARADAARTVAACEASKAAALAAAAQQRATNLKQAQAASTAATVRERRLATQLQASRHALQKAKQADQSQCNCVLSDAAASVLNSAARGPADD